MPLSPALSILTKTFQIIGEDVAGIVVQVGSSVSKVKKGDRVLGYCVSLATGVSAQGAFQNYTVVPEIAVSPIPDSLPFEQAAVVPLGVSTAAAALYQTDGLKLPYPKPGSPKSNKTSILVWGGSSSVGACAIQLAVASGVQVVTTCSKNNFDYVKGLGAAYVFDYNDASVLDEIVNALQGTEFAGVFDSISEEKTFKACGAVAEKMGGGHVVGTLQLSKGVDLGKGVTTNSGKSKHPASAIASLTAYFIQFLLLPLYCGSQTLATPSTETFSLQHCNLANLKLSRTRRSLAMGWRASKMASRRRRRVSLQQK